MTDLLNSQMVLPEPLNPPFADRPQMADLGRVHFIGVGGAGMSAVATLMAQAGVVVSGSDRLESAALEKLRALGVRVSIPQDAANIDGVDTVVVSTAIHADNPELVAARQQGLQVVHRSQALAAVMGSSQVVAVAGTHGKSTTSSMISVMFDGLGLDPSFAVGTVIAGQGTNARLGQQGPDAWFVAEADESDGSFVRYRPKIAVVTNIEPDHLDFYGSAEHVYEAFNRFVDSLAEGGVLVACADDPGAAALADRAREAGVRVCTYGESAHADVHLTNISTHGSQSSSDVSWWFERDGQRREGGQQLHLQVPGLHNQLNAAAALTTAIVAGADPADAVRALGEFVGADRRFTLRGEVVGVKVFDDYAHHPTEVSYALGAGRAVAGGHNLYVVFQPHLFSRTREFAGEFAGALSVADRVYVLDIYPAREEPIEGVTSELITNAGYSEVHYAAQPSTAIDDLVACARSGDIIMTVGAGDVTALGADIVRALTARHGSAVIEAESSDTH